ncbi:MAG: hypothetical protein NC121_17705 [Blautia sp.]|nr:hypothetical protein [Blautia sp.]
MKLIRIKINGYKHLRNIELDVANADEKNLPVCFLAGVNGTGKSAFLEAVALIFSRISQDELPGFDFEVVYEMFIEGERVRVTVRPEEERGLGRLYIEAGHEKFHSFEGHEKYLPYKVFVCISGQNSQMRQLVLDTARDSIFSDIHDAGMSERPEEIGRLVRYLEELQQNPRILYLDEEIAALVLFVLCAWKPRERGDYAKLRGRLLQKFSNGFSPVILSIAGIRERIETPLFSELMYHKREAEEQGNAQLASWVSEEEGRITAAYCIVGGKDDFCVERVADRYVNPLTLLINLLQAKNRGEMSECHILYQCENGSDLLTERSLSDGELLWIGRMGLVLLARQMETDNCLFLMDEPDVYLNESWNVDFMSYLQELTLFPESESAMHHNFLITTHSSLLLTDAPRNQIFLFGKKDGEIRVRQIPISLFAASRDEISYNMFRISAEIGNYADRQSEDVLDNEENPERILAYINQVGPGIRRFQLWDKYLELRERKDDVP